MFSRQINCGILSRLSNRSSLTPKSKNNYPTEKKILSSKQYLQLCKSQDEGPNQLIYDSLHALEKQIMALQGLLIVSQTKINLFRKLNTFKQIKLFTQNLTIPSQPLNQQEQAVFKPIFKTQKRKQCEKLAEILSQKQSQQRKAQEEFLTSMTQQYNEDKMKQLLGVMNMQRILNRKVAKQIKDGFNSLNKKASPQKQNEKIVKNILTSSFMMISIKLKLMKQTAFKTLLRQFGFGSISDRFDTIMKAKGKALMALKQYPRMNLRRAFWRWHLSTTDEGEKLFKKASDRLVLYTNINKASFFYRLYNQVRVKQIKVDPKVKRMTVMFYLYTKIFFERPMRTFFEKTKIFTARQGKQFQAIEKIIFNAGMREKNLFKKWLSKGKQMRNQQNLKKIMMEKLAKRIIQVSKQKKQYLIEGWKKVTQEKIKQNNLKTLFLTKLLSTKSGKFAQAFNNWKMLPQKVNLEAFKRISRFEKGLITFAQRTLKKAFKSFKFEYENAQAQKKRAVIQLINVTQGGQKKYFNKWKAQVLQHSLYQRCQILRRVFQNMNNSLFRNFSQIFRTRQYNLREVSMLQRFLQHTNDKKNNVLQETFAKLKENAKFSRVNNWFYKAASVFAIGSHITMQKSLWRLRTNALEKFGISQQKSDNLKSTNDSRQKITSIVETHVLRDQELLMANKDASINLCKNVFNENMRKQLSKWRYNVNPEKKFSESRLIIKKNLPEIDQYVNQLKGCMLIFEKLSKKHLLTLNYGFRVIMKHLKKPQRLNNNNNFSEQNTLMEKIQEYKKQNEALLQQLEDRQLHLEESNKNVTILTLRINYMVINKFVSLVEKVVDNNIWRCINQGFDCVIEMANENYQKEHENEDNPVENYETIQNQLP